MGGFSARSMQTAGSQQVKYAKVSKQQGVGEARGGRGNEKGKNSNCPHSADERISGKKKDVVVATTSFFLSISFFF
jgi:hypothetical protein